MTTLLFLVLLGQLGAQSTGCSSSTGLAIDCDVKKLLVTPAPAPSLPCVKVSPTSECVPLEKYQADESQKLNTLVQVQQKEIESLGEIVSELAKQQLVSQQMIEVLHDQQQREAEVLQELQGCQPEKP